MAIGTAWTDLEFGDVAEALLYPRERQVRHLFGLSPLDLGVQLLSQRLELVGQATKDIALQLARQINGREIEAFDEALDGLPNVQRFGNLYKDERVGYNVREEVMMKMRHKLARMLNVRVNPQAEAQMGGTGLNVRLMG